MAKKELSKAIEDDELTLAQYKAILSEFPDAILSETWSGYRNQVITSFSSKIVNTQYHKLSFEPGYGGIVVAPYCEVKCVHDDIEYVLKVHSIPKSSRLVYIRWREKVIRFSRLSFNLKNKEFSIKDDMLNECRSQILSFIKDHPGYKLDDKYLEPRLKKLLCFI